MAKTRRPIFGPTCPTAHRRGRDEQGRARATVESLDPLPPGGLRDRHRVLQPDRLRRLRRRRRQLVAIATDNLITDTKSNLQFVAFYDNGGNIIVGRRATGGSWQTFNSGISVPTADLTDDHDVISIAVDSPVLCIFHGICIMCR